MVALAGGISSAFAQGGTYQVVYAFDGSGGFAPQGTPVADGAGNLYGTTAGGCGYYGIVYKLAPDGAQTVLHCFKGKRDGAYPYGGLLRDSKGNLYGTTTEGGINNNGTVFRVAPDGKEKVLYAFTGGSDGATPYAGLIRDKANNLYGTTYWGGTGNSGIIFKLTPQGAETVLYTFSGGGDGANPLGNLMEDAAGNLYGTASWGGGNFAGTVFKLAPDNSLTTLYTFTNQSDGGHPYGGVIADKSGNLYGTTAYGGAGYGTVFMLAPNGAETVLHDFAGGSDGENPQAGLIADKAGDLYGTTLLGGAGGYGTIFEIAPGGSETVLYSFAGGSDGAYPYAGLIKDRAENGSFYGAASFGGTGGYGTLFKVGNQQPVALAGATDVSSK